MLKKSVDGMIDDITREVEYARRLIGIHELKQEVLQAISEVPRDEFVPAQLRSQAFDNGPLPIGNGQTISQPFIVALMTDLLNTSSDEKILEIGTGSGYQTAILARLANVVFTVEIVEELATSASLRLQQLGFTNIYFKTGNGAYGWEEHAPFDGVIVTAAAPDIPEALVDQLKIGGRMVIPVGPRGMHQDLILVTKQANNTLIKKNVLGVSFVPFIEIEK